jgi:nitrate/TMAO reductase-like tetraheme cytochrome c subunit
MLAITPAMEQQIFAENPAVAAVYAKTVPYVRTREKFYEQYIEMLRHRVERRRKRASGACSSPSTSILNRITPFALHAQITH